MRISQEAFDEVVRENLEDLGMDPEEALQDAIQTLTLQGVNLSGIITSIPTDKDDEHPLLLSLSQLKTFLSDSPPFQVLPTFLSHFTALVSDDLQNAAIACNNGAVELLTSICSLVPSDFLLSSLTALLPLLRDVESNERFQRCGGAALIVSILNKEGSFDLENACFKMIAATSTGSEVVKEEWVNLKVDTLLLKALSSSQAPSSVYEAIQALLSSDDPRVAASQVYGYARRFAKLGIAEALLPSLSEGITSPSLISAASALKSLLVNDEICRSIADKGSIDAVLRCLDDSGDQYNKSVALTCCSLLSKLAGSDTNKCAIVEKGGMNKLMRLCARFADDSSVIQEVFYIISVLSLRNPDHASRAIEAGAGDLVIQAMLKFPASQLLQKNACLMIRNLVVRNSENRNILLQNGIEKIIRKAKENHRNCKDAATDALRDLGLANYNL